MCKYACLEVFDVAKGGDERVGVCALDGNAEEFAGEDVAGAVEAANVAVLGGTEAAVGSLRSPQAELEQTGGRTGGEAKASRVCRHQAGEVDEHEQCGLEQLHLEQRALEAHQRHARKYERTLAYRIQLQVLHVHVAQKLEELVLDCGRHHLLQVLNICLFVELKLLFG